MRTWRPALALPLSSLAAAPSGSASAQDPLRSAQWNLDAIGAEAALLRGRAVIDRREQTATSLGNPTQLGHGLLNMAAAVAALAPPLQQSAPPATLKATVSKRVRFSTLRGSGLPVTCTSPQAATCSVRVTSKRRVLARGSGKVAAGVATKIGARLSRSGRRTMAGANRRVDIRVTVDGLAAVRLTTRSCAEHMQAQRVMGLPIVGACIVAGAWCAPVHARDAVVTSFDGTRIVAHFHPAGGQPAGTRAPTVLVGQGYPSRGDQRPDLDASDAIGTATLRAAGYNVLTWDPRGLGDSGGTVMFNSPDFEARDVSALIDFAAAQPETLLDGARDPRVGMSGSSYGGGIQFVSAAVDRRIDAIMPDIAWHSLLTSFFRDGAVKAGWLTLICGGGEAAALTGGLFFGAAGLQLGGTATELRTACLEALAAGRISTASSQWIASRGPGDLVDNIRAPTLITQGTVDTLFALGESIANYDRLRRNGVPVKMLWYCGGHGECHTPRGDPRHVARAGLAWFARWLKRDAGVDTGAQFEWIGDDGVWRAGPDYPLAPLGSLNAKGHGAIRIGPLDGIIPGRAADGATARFSSPTSAGDVVGEPFVKLAYRGTGLPSRTFLYAQILDGHRIAGGQTTPIPVVLDGRTHTIERSLETLALRGRPASNLRLQIRSSASAYGPQRAIGNVRLMSIQAALPLVDATRSGRSSRDPSAKRTPRRLRIFVSSHRLRGSSRIVVRSTLRSRPCSGSVRFTIRSGVIKRTIRAAIAPNCAIRATLRLPVRAGRRVRVAALFEGNDQLTPRRANSLVRRVR